MAESEQTGSKEVSSPVVERVKSAIERVWKKPKYTEYQQIRKQLDSRLDWHGGGVYGHYVKTMDTVSRYLFKDKFVPVTLAKVINRGVGAWLGVNAAVADIGWNVVTWPLRRKLPIPKDIFKRGAIAGTYALAGVLGVGETMLNVDRGIKRVAMGSYNAITEGPKNTQSAIVNAEKQVLKAALFPAKAISEQVSKHSEKIKAASEAIITAPEVAGIMIKKRVDAITAKIKKPFTTVKA
jgi:hypothetical protein